MKKAIVTFFCLLIFSEASVFAATTNQDAYKETYKRADKVLSNLKRSNNFSKDYRIVVTDTTETISTVSREGTLYLPTSLLSTCETDDIFAANIAILIGIKEAQNMPKDKFKRGAAATINFIPAVLVWPNECAYTDRMYYFWSNENYVVGDLLAADYLKNAKYNPLALMVAISRISDSTPGALGNKKYTGKQRQKFVYGYINKKYPQYLSKSSVQQYKDLTYVYCLENNLECSETMIPDKFINKKEKVYNKGRNL